VATLSTQQVAITGGAVTYGSAAGGGDKVVPDGRTMLHVKNGGGSSITVTVVVPGSTYGQANPDVAVTVPNGGERMIGPFPIEIADPADGLVAITYSAVTSVTVAAVRV
jgi:hypothetical protein